MKSNTRRYRASDLRSGGKIVRPRRTTAAKTPYERPPTRVLPNSGPQNPNWLSRLILSPTRMIATGAGKVLSVFRYDSSSSSSSSSDDDFTSEVEIDNDDDISSQDVNKLEKSSPDDIIPRAIQWKSETKCAIERLLMQESFSREECDRLTYIIKSRVVDSPVTQGMDGRLTEIPDKTAGSDADLPALCSAAVTEAKKWLEEKKLGSNSKSELDYGACTLNTVMLPHVTEGEVGSPVDLAKSYMQARPSWASPSRSNIQLPSPTSAGMQLFKEETSYSFGGNSLSASKLIRDSSAAGSWNIQEEIRKVRSRATEDMLRTRPSSAIDWSALASDIKSSPGPLVAYKAESVSQMAQGELQNESPAIDLATLISKQSQDLRVAEITGTDGLWDGSDGKEIQPPEDAKAGSQNGDAPADAHKDEDEESQHFNCTIGKGPHDSRSQEINCSTLEEAGGKDDAVCANGVLSGLSLYGGQKMGQDTWPIDERQHTSVDAGDDKMTRTDPVEDTCELLSESYMEVPIVSESDVAVAGSQNSSSMHHEGLSQEMSPRTLKRKAGKSNVMEIEKQQGGKRRYVRKTRVRGK